MFGQGMDAYSNDLTPAQIAWWLQQEPKLPGIGLSLYDVWVYKAPQWDEIPMASWTPVDHSVVPHEVKQWFDRRGKGKWAIAMSQFGERELLEAGVERERVFYAPHSFNPAIYKPTPSTIRKDLNIPEDAHLTIVQAANKGVSPVRKSFGEQFLAWSTWANSRPDAYLYVHSDIFGLAGGVNLEKLLLACKAPMDRVRFVPQFEYRQGIPQEVMAKIYSAGDALAHCSKGEGFGVSIIEGQACGLLPIITEWTAMPELLGAGWKVGGQVEYDPHQGGWWMTPNIKEIMDALEQSYELKKKPTELAEAKSKAMEFMKNYETAHVYNTHWRPILKQLEEEVTKPVAINREQRRAAKKRS
jgi:glycosyltransferase involved in cell wall biosynthesis